VQAEGFRRDVGHLVEVVRAAQAEVDIGPVHAVGFDLRHPADLLLAAVAGERMIQVIGEELHLRVAAGLDHGCVDGAHQR